VAHNRAFGSRPNACAKVLNLFAGICRSSGTASGARVSNPRRLLLRKANYSANCSYKMIPGSTADTFQEYSFA